MATSKNIYLLIGDDILKEEFIEDLINTNIPEEVRELNVEFLRAGELTTNALLQRANTFPLFSPHQVIIIGEIEKLRKREQIKLADAIEKIPTFTILILSAANKEEIKEELFEKLKGVAVVRYFAFSPKKGEALQQRKQWIQAELQKRGSRIEPEALEILAEAPMELRQLRNEIEKLSTYAQGRTISLEDVHTIMTSTEEVKVYQFTNAVLEGKFVEAMRLLDLLLETGDMWTPLITLQALVSQVRLLLQVKILQEAGVPLFKEGKGDGKTEMVPISLEEIPPPVKQLLLEGEENIVRYLQKRSWLGKSLLHQTRRFSKSSLFNLLRLLFRLDIEIKQGADPRERLEWFILEMAGASAASDKSSTGG